MIGTAIQPQTDEDPVYDVVIVVEKTANLVPYLEELKAAYLLPTLEYFNGGPPSPIDTGHDYNCTLYCLVTYTAGDTAPEMASDCTFPTTSTYELIQGFDKLEFVGGAGQSCAHLSEGLSTALQCLDEIKQLRYSGKPTQRHCILICNSPPYHIVAEESQDYRGYNSEQLASMMGKRGVNLSIIAPRKIPALQKLFNEACSGDSFYIPPQVQYAVDPRHLVLLKGYQLQERSVSPKGEKDKDNMNVPSPALVTDPALGKADTFKKPISQTGLQQNSPQNGMQPSPTQLQTSMGLQQNPNPPVTGNMPAVMDNLAMTTGMQPAPGQPAAGAKSGVMSHTRPQGTKLQQQAAISGGNIIQPQMQQRLQQDPGFVMRQSGIGASGQGMMVSQPQSVAMSSAGSMMNPHMSSGMTSQANMMVSQTQSNMIMQPGGLMQPSGVMAGHQPQPPQPQPPQSLQLPFSQQQDFINGQQGQSQMININQMPMVPGTRERSVIWSGTMEYQDRNGKSSNQRNVTFLLNCNVSVDVQDTDINTADWPQKLTIQLLPQAMLTGLQQQCKNSRQVFFHFPNSNSNNCNPDALRNLYQLMGQGFAGCVSFPSTSEIRIILLMYSAKKKSFIGLIPNDQAGIVAGIKTVVTHHRLKAQVQGVSNSMAGVSSNAGTTGMPNPVMAGGAISTTSGNMVAGGMMQSQMPTPVNTAQQTGLQQQTQQQQQQQQQAGEQRRQANLQIMQNMHADLQVKQFQQQQQHQQQAQVVDQKKAIMAQQQQQQQQQVQQQQQMLAHRAKMQHQQQMQAQRLQMQQQQQQQQVANPQLRHLLINAQQQQLRQQQQQMMMQQQMRGGNPQGQPGAVMGPGGQQGMQGGGMGQMTQQPGQNFMDDFNLPEII